MWLHVAAACAGALQSFRWVSPSCGQRAAGEATGGDPAEGFGHEALIMRKVLDDARLM